MPHLLIERCIPLKCYLGDNRRQYTFLENKQLAGQHNTLLVTVKEQAKLLDELNDERHKRMREETMPTPKRGVEGTRLHYPRNSSIYSSLWEIGLIFSLL